MYDLYAVPPNMIDEFMPFVGDHLERGLVACNSDDKLTNVWAKLLEQKSVLWVVTRNNIGIVAAGITEILITNSGTRLLNVGPLGGAELAKWMHLWPRIEDYAKREQCSRVRFTGRRGWRKLMKGYSEPWVTLEKEI